MVPNAEFKPKKDLLYDVITHTIMLDNELEVLFRNYFGLEPGYDSSDGTISNLNQIERFGRHFMQNMGAGAKIDLLKDIIADKKFKGKFPTDFDNKFVRFYKIRNIFAHSMYPKEVDQKRISLPSEGNWETLHSEHTVLYSEILEFIAIRFHTIRLDVE